MYANENSGDWKKHIITDEPETENTEEQEGKKPGEIDELKNVKDEIIDLAYEEKVTRKELLQRIMYPETEIKQAVEELKENEFLEVTELDEALQ